MEVEEILLKVAGLKSVYGEAARMCLIDPNLSKQFLLECYQEILEDRVALEKHLGIDLVKEIVMFTKEEYS
ncbi:MAG: hypothetical protein IPI93_06115 [Sphingobacteriaceae bacterium]|nr:hypothetical protein [Sphingobacteriaceae bacterium]MBK7816340.1 hypothetical protein [Sphingobacteriaceae bacterium]